MDSARLHGQDYAMLIAQITDIHLGFDPGNPGEANRLRLNRVIAALNALSPRPDVLLVTGDIADRGTAKAYAQFREAMSAIACPVYCCPGNHDRRENFRAALPQPDALPGFIQYGFDMGELRVLVLDTLEEGRHGGAFCAFRAAWLRAELAKAPNTPTVIAMHHPPAATGIGWLDCDPGEPWIARLAHVLAGRPQLIKGNRQILFRGMGRLTESSIVNTKNKYMVTMAQNLYFHAMADNRGAMTKLADRAAVGVDVDVLERRRLAEAGHALHVAAHRDDEARAHTVAPAVAFWLPGAPCCRRTTFWYRGRLTRMPSAAATRRDAPRRRCRTPGSPPARCRTPPGCGPSACARRAAHRPPRGARTC